MHRLIVITSLLLLTSCMESADSNRELSVREYGEWCAELDQADTNPNITWGEIVPIIRDGLKEYDSTKPPPELVEFHSVSRNAVEAMLDFGKRQDSDAQINPFILMFEPTIMIIGSALTQAEADIPADIHAVLVETGCLDEEDSDEG